MDIEYSTLIWLFRIVFFLLAIVAAGQVWRFMQRDRYIDVQNTKRYSLPTNKELPEKIISLYIVANGLDKFNTPRLFKMMHQLGFQFSENNSFDYYLKDKRTIVFSIINTSKTNEFSHNPHNMKPTGAITAFMQFPILDGNKQVEYFHLLLSILEEIRSGLNAQLFNPTGEKLTSENLYTLQKEIEEFEQNYCRLIRNG